MKLTNLFLLTKNKSSAKALREIPEGSWISITWDAEKSLRGVAAEVDITLHNRIGVDTPMGKIKVNVLMNLIKVHKTVEVKNIG